MLSDRTGVRHPLAGPTTNSDRDHKDKDKGDDQTQRKLEREPYRGAALRTRRSKHWITNRTVKKDAQKHR
jgi:hypothetical protein